MGNTQGLQCTKAISKKKKSSKKSKSSKKDVESALRKNSREAERTDHQYTAAPSQKPPVPPPRASDTDDNTVIALYGYNAKNDGDLSFRKGERLIVIKKLNPDWWQALKIDTGEKGFIPANYVVSDDLEAEE